VEAHREHEDDRPYHLTRSADVQVADMVIRIAIDTTEPLSGTAATERCEPVPFVGWLEMLRAISELVEPTKVSRAAARREPVASTAHDGDEWVWLLHGDVSTS
jgi:hypothetical protein